MIYEFRTYDLEPRSVEQFGENTKAKLDGRLKLSPLGGFWLSLIHISETTRQEAI